MIAYTFELAGFIHVGSDRFTLYTQAVRCWKIYRRISMEHYGEEVKSFSMRYGVEADREEVQKQFRLETMLQTAGGAAGRVRLRVFLIRSDRRDAV